MPLILTILQHGATYHFTWQEASLAANSQFALACPPSLRLSSVQLDAQQQADLQQAIFAAAQVAQHLTALATTDTGRSTGAVKTLEHLGRLMFSQLLPPDLQAELRRLPPATPLVLSTNDTQWPWELLHDDQHFLALHLAPGRQLLTAVPARQNPTSPRQQYHCLLIGDPTGDLPAAQAEIETLFNVLDSLDVQIDLLSAAQATCTRVLQELAVGHYDIIHYAGHARPGALCLADGWLESDKIYSALRGTPLIFLNACASLGSAPDAQPGALHYAGQGVTDLAAAFLLGGARALIGTLWPIFDQGAQALAVDFYRALLQGTPIGAALRHARERSRHAPVDTLIWSALALYGDPQSQFVRQSIAYRNSTALVAMLPDPPVSEQAGNDPAPTPRLRRLAHDWHEAAQATGGQVITLSASLLVAIFGAPQTVEDDAERALLAALEFFRLCQASALDAPALGVASGPLYREPLAAIPAATPFYWGPALTAAQQCAAAAQPGQVVTTLATHRLTEHKFVFTPILLPTLASSAEDAPALLVTSLALAAPAPPAPPAELARVRPLIGRHEELATLQSHWQNVRRGQGRSVGIVGEAGIGKSRLVQGFQDACAADAQHWLAASGSLITQKTSYDLVRQLLRALLQIAPGAQLPQIEQKIHQAVTHLPKLAAWEQASQLLQELLGLQQRQLTGDEQAGRRNLQVQLLRTLLAQRAQTAPLAVVLENLHQADSASLELLAQVTAGIQPLPILVLLLYRPGWEHPWLGRHDQFHTLALAALDSAAQVHLLQAWLDSVELPRNLPALLERTGGNPLFLEEALRSLQEERVLVRQGGQWLLTRTWTDVQLPETIQRIFLARLDHQPAATRRALPVAAVIDAAFTPALLGAVLGEEAVTVEACLAGCDLLAVDWASGTYTIRHPLIQEIAYQQLAPEDRRRWHRRIADHLARQPQPPADLTPVDLTTVAHHYYYSHDRVNAVRYGLRAMQQTAADWANQIALDWANRVLEKLDTFATQPLTAREQAQGSTPQEWTAWRLAALEQKGDVQATLGLNTEAITSYQLVLHALPSGTESARARQAALYVKLAEAHLSRSNMDAAGLALEAGLTLLNELPCPEFGQLIFWQAMLQRRREQIAAALTSSQQAAAILQATGSLRYLARTYTLQGMLYRARGREFYAQAIAVLEESIALSKTDNYLPGLARASSSLGILYENLGEWEKSLHYYAEGLQASARSGNERQLATTHLDFSEIYRHQGKFDAASEHAAQAQQMAERLHFPDIDCVAHINLGLIYLRQQQFTAAAAQLERAETLLSDHDLVSYQADLLNAQAELCLAQQLNAAALEKAQSALAWAQPKSVLCGQVQRTLGLIYLADGDLDAAAQALTHSRELLTAAQNRYELALTLLASAHYHQQRHAPALALDDCTQAGEIFTALGAQFDQQRAATLLARLNDT